MQMQISKNLSTQKQVKQLGIVSNVCDRPSKRTFLVMDMNGEWFWEIKLWNWFFICVEPQNMLRFRNCMYFLNAHGLNLKTNVHFVSCPDYKFRNIFKSRLDYIIYMIYGMCVGKIQFYSTWIFAGILVINTNSIVKLYICLWSLWTHW